MYFTNIKSLSGLKRQYRKLAMENHPDRGGDTAVMQAINEEFKRLFVIWKDLPDTETDNGYGSDGDGMSASEYVSHVYSEYRWEGENYKRYKEYSTKRICEHIRTWLKETYPSYKFSVTKDGYQSINVALMAADFYPFKDKEKLHGDIRNYSLRDDGEDSPLTDRCREVMRNVKAFVDSWNFDDSDIQTDYFCTNFYEDISIGTYGKSFEYRPISLKSTQPTYRRKVGPVEKAVRDAMGAGNAFLQEKKYDGGKWVVDTESPFYLCKNDENHYPVWYSQPSLLRTRLEKLAAVGIEVKCVRRKIILVGYSAELTAALAAEKAEEDKKEKAFYEALASGGRKTPAAGKKTAQKEKETASPLGNSSVEIIEYSEKAVAVKGDTKPLAELLKSLGGKFNPRLSFGPGWIFSKSKEPKLREALAMAS